VAIISSSQAKVDAILSKANNAKLKGHVGNVRDETPFIELLISLAPIDHLIFSGVDKIIRGPIADADFDECRHLFGVKFWGSAVCGKAAAKHDIIRPGGSLTLTSGTGGVDPGVTASIGGALNAGLFTMTRGLAQELKEKKIRVNCVVPGIVATELWDKMGMEDQETKLKKMGSALPVGFCGTPEHIAEAYLYAVRADYATGSLITIGKETPRRGGFKSANDYRRRWLIALMQHMI
jgi:NAD(P)-dependent dehydrogenase (short-subunit alcohol dehydrogenase family)